MTTTNKTPVAITVSGDQSEAAAMIAVITKALCEHGLSTDDIVVKGVTVEQVQQLATSAAANLDVIKVTLPISVTYIGQDSEASTPNRPKEDVEADQPKADAAQPADEVEAEDVVPAVRAGISLAQYVKKLVREHPLAVKAIAGDSNQWGIHSIEPYARMIDCILRNTNVTESFSCLDALLRNEIRKVTGMIICVSQLSPT